MGDGEKGGARRGERVHKIVLNFLREGFYHFVRTE